MSTKSRDGDCAKARELFSLSLDEELDALRLHKLERHLAVCPDCRLQTARLEAITSMLRTAPLEPAPAFVLPRSARWRRPLYGAVPTAAALVALSLGLGLMQGSVRGGSATTTPAPPQLLAVSELAEITYAPPPQPPLPKINTAIVWTP